LGEQLAPVGDAEKATIEGVQTSRLPACAQEFYKKPLPTQFIAKTLEHEDGYIGVERKEKINFSRKKS